MKIETSCTKHLKADALPESHSLQDFHNILLILIISAFLRKKRLGRTAGKSNYK